MRTRKQGLSCSAETKKAWYSEQSCFQAAQHMWSESDEFVSMGTTLHTLSCIMMLWVVAKVLSFAAGHNPGRGGWMRGNIRVYGSTNDTLCS